MAMFMLRLSGVLSLANETNMSNLFNTSPFTNTTQWPQNYGDNFPFFSKDDILDDFSTTSPTLVNNTSKYSPPYGDHSQISRRENPLLLSTADNSKNADHLSKNGTSERYTTIVPIFEAIASPLIASSPSNIPGLYNDDGDDGRNNVVIGTDDTNSIMNLNNNVQALSRNATLSNNNSALISNELEDGDLSPESPKDGDNTVKNYANVHSTEAIPTPKTVKIKAEDLLEEDDSILDLVIDPSITAELKEPSAEFVTSEFEYYDFTAEKDTLYVPPTLTSHSLVSPVPYPRPRITHSASEARDTSRNSRADTDINEIYGHHINVVEQSQAARKKKVIQPVMVSSGSLNRNNPYPYGPMYLPGYTKDSSTRRTSLPTRPRTQETTTKSSVVVGVQPPEEEYEYEYDVYDYKESSYKVQTQSPPVLFHFEGPGYVPEAPSTTAPPVRAATPSDPWDCAPKCPIYTLEDWNPFYDVRLYPKITWLSTIIISNDRVLAELEGYMKLQDYFYGLNDRGQILNLSVPFITQIKHGRHPGVLSEVDDFTISLHMPPGAVGVGYDLPTPISNEVLIDTLEAKTIFVSSFVVDVWEVTKEFLEKKVEAMMTRLRNNGEAFIDRYYYLASYSRPELYQPVYYELWMYATSLRRPHPTPPDPLPRPRMAPLSKLTQDTMQRLCRGIECPSFEVIRSYKYGIQKRRYFDVVFASVSPGDCYFSTLSVWKGFMPLHLYKHGINSHMEVVEATRPIAVVRVQEDSTPNTECPQNLTMSLFLPRRLHAAPPVTGFTAPGPVVITVLEDVMVFAYTVGGYLLEPYRVRKELSDLKYRLSEFGACFKDDDYYIVVYDFIARYHGRQNEIWIVAENCRATKNG